ncbi:mRNA capping enzyme subunit beta [Encephalitozoon hellem]|nr:mRNA capping enzyme subunit beta [Encephalitozoon hellem]
MEDLTKILKGPVKEHSEYLRKFILAFKNERKELEIRLGKIVSKEDGSRLRVDAVAPVVFRDIPTDYRFESAVDFSDFNTLKKHFSTFKSEAKNDVVIINEDGRETYENGVLKKVEKKIRSQKLDIFIPNKKYDVRLVLSEENEAFKRPSKKKAIVKRVRRRETYFMEPYGFDFTETILSGEKDEKEKRKFEIEVEVFSSEKLVSNDFVSLIYNFNIDLPTQ